jgi:hypothetical protein
MFEKTAYEEIYRYRDFAPWLAAGETLTTVAVLSTEKGTGTDVSADMIASAGTYGTPATKAKFTLKAGVAGTTYIIKVQVTTSGGQKFESRMEYKVL